MSAAVRIAAERLGIYKSKETLLREHRVAKRDLPDLRLAEAPDPDQAQADMVAHREAIAREKEARRQRELEASPFYVSPDRQREIEEQRRREAEARRAVERERRLVADRRGGAVILRDAAELEALRASEQLRRERQRHHAVVGTMGIVPMVASHIPRPFSTYDIEW